MSNRPFIKTLLYEQLCTTTMVKLEPLEIITKGTLAAPVRIEHVLRLGAADSFFPAWWGWGTTFGACACGAVSYGLYRAIDSYYTPTKVPKKASKKSTKEPLRQSRYSCRASGVYRFIPTRTLYPGGGVWPEAHQRSPSPPPPNQQQAS